MKSLKYIIIGLLIIILIYSSISCTEKAVTNRKTITLESVVKTFPKELLSESKKIMVKRLECINIKDYVIEENIFQSQIVINLNEKENIKSIAEVLKSRGKASFLESFKRNEVLSNLRKGLKSDCSRVLDSILGITVDKAYPDAIIGQANVKDTFVIGKFFRAKAVKSILPSKAKLCWSLAPNSSNKFELYAVSTESYGLDETALSDIHTSKSENYFGVSMTFKQEYIKTLENLTSRNIDKAIAFLIDGKVYSAPVVRSAITSGKVEITGNFTEEDANGLVAIIGCGELPLDFLIK